MPTVVTETPYLPVPMEPPRKKWTRAECLAMEASGVWDEQQRLELVEGELIDKRGKKRPHTIALTFLREALGLLFGGRYINTETTIDVASQDNPSSEPQPDLIVLAKPSQEFRGGNPQPADLRLVAARRLVVHRDPLNGSYQSVTVYNQQESLSPLALPDHELRVADAFPA
jgi:Uma2 family endonuclease